MDRTHDRDGVGEFITITALKPMMTRRGYGVEYWQARGQFDGLTMLLEVWKEDYKKFVDAGYPADLFKGVQEKTGLDITVVTAKDVRGHWRVGSVERDDETWINKSIPAHLRDRMDEINAPYVANDSAATDTREQSPKALETAYTGEFAPFYAVGQVYTFINTVDELFVCQVDVISKSGKVFAYGENPRSFNGLFYQRIDTIPTLQPAPKWLTLRAMSADDCAWIEQMRDDQLTPEDDREFVRNEDLPRW